MSKKRDDITISELKYPSRKARAQNHGDKTADLNQSPDSPVSLPAGNFSGDADDSPVINERRCDAAPDAQTPDRQGGKYSGTSKLAQAMRQTEGETVENAQPSDGGQNPQEAPAIDNTGTANALAIAGENSVALVEPPRKKPRNVRAAVTLAAAVLVMAVVMPIVIASYGSPAKSPAAITVATAATPEPVAQSTPEPTPSPTPESTPEAAALPAAPEPSPTKTPYLMDIGYIGDDVKELQLRLIELDYMENDEPTDYFGPQIKYSVQLFQRKHDLENTTGAVDSETLALVNDENAKRYSVSLGSSGTDVREIQKRLSELGYLEVEATGYFNTDTEKAVAKFQKLNDLSADGNVGHATREKLYSENAREAGYVAPTPSPTKEPKATPTPKPSDKPEAKPTPEETPVNAKPQPTQPPSSLPSPNEPPVNALPTPSLTPVPGQTAAPLPTPEITPPPPSTNHTPDSGRVNSMLSFAQTLIGSPYVRGGKGPSEFDCSGFVYYCLKNGAGVSVNYMTSGTWASTNKFEYVASISDLVAGDIMCVNGHVGIYMGGNSVIHASSSRAQVVISSVSEWWHKEWICGKRPL